jgi:hypothetical protein
MKRAFAQRQIPTLLGLGILIAALIGGTALIGVGGGVFAPRATPQTTPKNLRITNVKDTSFTVSFMTDEKTTGFIKYGKSESELKTQASDDRDQLTGNVTQYSSHYITVRDLDPNTDYFFTVGTASVPKFDNNGAAFTVKTAAKAGNPTAAKTAYGTVNTSSGTPADGAILYLSIEGVSELSALVKSSGSWAIPLSNARTTDLSNYANIEPTQSASIFVQGATLDQTTSAQAMVTNIQPAEALVLNSGGSSAAPTDTEVVNTELNTVPSSSPTSQGSLTSFTNTSPSPIASPSGSPASASPSATPAVVLASPTSQQADTVDMTVTEQQTVETDKPTITGKAAPNTVITIEVNSETQIVTQVRTDENGNFVLALSSGQTALEPGEHTVKITYTDPATGEQKTEVKTFYVADDGPGLGGGPQPSSALLAQATTSSPSPSPFGTQNPFTISSPSPTATVSASTSATPRVAIPSTNSAIPKSGSVEITFMLIAAGLFMIVLGAWTYHHNLSQALIDSEDESL